MPTIYWGSDQYKKGRDEAFKSLPSLPRLSDVVSTLAPVASPIYNSLPPTVSVARAVPPALLNSATAAGKLAALKYLPALTGVKGATVLGTIHKYSPYAQWGWNLFKSGALSSKPVYTSSHSRGRTYTPSKPNLSSHKPMARYVRRGRRRYGGRLSFSKARSVPSYRRSVPANRVSVVQRFPRAQIKQNVVSVTQTSVALGGAINPITNIAHGTAEDDREGSVVKLLSFHIRGQVFRDIDSKNPVNAPLFVRIVVFKWLQNYSSPSPTTIFTSSPYYSAPFNQLEQKNFQVLYDELFTLSPTTFDGTDYTFPARTFSIRKVLNTMISYNGPAATNGDTSYFVCVLPSDVSNHTTMRIATRFIDL